MNMASDPSRQCPDLDARVRKFRIASRELFNTYFAIPEPWKDTDKAWQSMDYFVEIEAAMFNYMVLAPENMALIRYGQTHPGIDVGAKPGILALPAMINRDISSGYWDFALPELPPDVSLNFVSFFDWSDLDLRDNEFVKVIVRASPSSPDIVGKQALVRPINVIFSKTP
jgi:hypothetical protein